MQNNMNTSTHSGNELNAVEQENHSIFQHPRRLWNVDETEISADYGKIRKVYSSANSNHGGFFAQSGSGPSKHVTAIVDISAAGDVAPPFLIVKSRNIMLNWFEPLTLEDVNRNPTFWWLTFPD